MEKKPLTKHLEIRGKTLSDCDRIATKKQTDHLAILDPDGTDEFVG